MTPASTASEVDRRVTMGRMLRSELVDGLERRPEAFREGERALQTELEARQVRFGNGLLPTYAVPFFAGEAQLAGWVAASERLAAAIETVARAALTDGALYRRLGLAPEARPLLDIDPGYAHITSLSRPDAVIVDGEPRFIEFNCDSPAMMAFSDALAEIFLALPLYSPLRARLRGERMIPRLVEALLSRWREFGGQPAVPTVAITDWAGQKTRFEHQMLQRSFEAAGLPTVMCDPRALRRNGRALELDGRTVHLVYRRALFGELLARQAEVEPLLSAYRDGAVCMVNSLRSYVASSKTLLAVLCEEAGSFGAQAILPSLAPTARIEGARLAALEATPLSAVLKRGESHGGDHVLLPSLTDEKAWHAALSEARTVAWVAQEPLPVPTLTILRSDGNALRREEKFYNWNPFLFDGRYAGGIARLSDTPLINISLGGGLLPTLTLSD